MRKKKFARELICSTPQHSLDNSHLANLNYPMQGKIKGKVLQKLLFSKSKMFVGLLSLSSEVDMNNSEFSLESPKNEVNSNETFLLLSILFKGKDKNDRLPHSLKEQLGVGDIIEISGKKFL